MGDLPQTAWVSVSRRGHLDCKDVARSLAAAGICARVDSNTSATPHLENGCSVGFEAHSKSAIAKVWRILEGEWGFRCAHVWVPGTFQGCVHDILRPSECPGTRLGQE